MILTLSSLYDLSALDMHVDFRAIEQHAHVVFFHYDGEGA